MHVYISNVNIRGLLSELSLRGGGGGGGGGSLFFVVVKLDFEIAVDQQTKVHDKTFEGVPDSGCPQCSRDSHALIWSIFSSILPNHLYMLKTVLWCALLVATSHLNTYKCPANFRICHQFILKTLLKIPLEIQFYVDSEDFMKKY